MPTTAQGDAYHSGGSGTSDNLQRALLAARRRERHHLREHAVLLNQRRHLLRGDLRRAAGLSAARNLQTKRSWRLQRTAPARCGSRGGGAAAAAGGGRREGDLELLHMHHLPRTRLRRLRAFDRLRKPCLEVRLLLLPRPLRPRRRVRLQQGGVLPLFSTLPCASLSLGLVV